MGNRRPALLPFLPFFLITFFLPSLYLQVVRCIMIFISIGHLPSPFLTAFLPLFSIRDREWQKGGGLLFFSMAPLFFAFHYAKEEKNAALGEGQLIASFVFCSSPSLFSSGDPFPQFFLFLAHETKIKESILYFPPPLTRLFLFFCLRDRFGIGV